MQFYAKDIMTTNVITARPEMTCDELADVLSVNKITGVPVVNDRGILVGVITIHDLLKAEKDIPYAATDYFSQTLLDQELGEIGFHLEPAGGFISDYMTRKVYTVSPDTPVEELAALMYRHRIHRVIVVNTSEQKPVGIITTFDLLKMLAEMGSTADITR